MSSQKYISVKSCGNPQSAGGFMTLTLFNSPNFLIEDRAISGFQANSYFFSLIIEKAQVVYKLYKNNVRSFGAFRSGTLVIAFSVPKGYGFRDGINPYKVMIALKDEFLSTCMTCRDPKLETYEFNEGQIDPKILDSVAEQFPLVEHEGPYCEMSLTGSAGYLILPENEIEQFLNDVQYRELQKYSEVFIAENLENPQSSALIPNLPIPRRPQYKITVDGQPRQVEADIDKQLTFSSQANERFYENGSVSFSIRDLLAGKNPDPSHIRFDRIREEVQISIRELEKPRKEKYQLILNPHQEFFLKNQSRLQLTYGNNKIKLNKDLTFELTGEQIAYRDRPNAFEIKYYGEDRSDYSFSSPTIDENNNLIYNVRKNEYHQEPPAINPGGNRKKAYGETQQHLAPRQFVFNFEDGDEELFNKRLTLRLKVKSGNDIFSTIVNFSKKGKANYEGVMNVPEQIKNPMTVEYRTPDGDLYRTNELSIDKGTKEVTQSYFVYVKEKFMDKKISRLKGLIGTFALALLLVGAGSGYCLRGCTMQDKTTQPTKQPTNGGVNPISVGDDKSEQQTNELTEQEAKDCISAWKSTLHKKDVTFAEIDEIYNLYANNGYSQYCSDQDRKIIEDYYQVKTLIVNGSFDELKKVGDMNWAISMEHKILIENATVRFENKKKFNQAESIEAKSQFVNNFSNYKSFTDIKPYKKSTTTEGGHKKKDKKKNQGGGSDDRD